MKKIIVSSLNELFKYIDINKKNISFHHHLRNGDFVINNILNYYYSNNKKGINLFISSIFPSYTSILTGIKQGNITNITTNYINGEVGEYISNNGLIGTLVMETHGLRPRNIIEGVHKIDIAFIAAPYVDKKGNATGSKGKSKCGTLGYAVSDSKYARKTVIVTDHISDEYLTDYEIDGVNVDYILVVENIGDSRGIVSGTTHVTTSPTGIKIAKDTVQLLSTLGYLRTGFSYQSGAGGISLKVTEILKEYMIKNNVKASFFTGGITKKHVEMLEEGLVHKLYDVQCFDCDAIESISRNENHIAISASKYANINDRPIIRNLDIAILGAAEIDLNYNVNVTTNSLNTIIGGSGGHSDIASESNISIVVTPLLKGRIPVVTKRVNTITTLGKNIDVLITDKGISINPLRTDLLQIASNKNIELITINEQLEIAHSISGIPREINKSNIIIGSIVDRDNKVIDHIYRK